MLRVAPLNSKGKERNFLTDDEEDASENSLYESIGCMFESQCPTVLKHFNWVLPSSSSLTSPSNSNEAEKDESLSQQKTTSDQNCKTIQVVVRVVDDDPGAVQSGHYLWPASLALCEYMIDCLNPSKQASMMFTEDSKSFLEPTTILELGAGCGIVSLVAMQLFQESLQCLILTDRDAGTLEGARDNYETTLEEMYEGADNEEEQMNIINDISSIPVEFKRYLWGCERHLKKINETLQDHSPNASNDDRRFEQQNEAIGVDMILGSDLIDCPDIVESLFSSATDLMTENYEKAIFLLSQSFPYDKETEAEIDNACEQHELERFILMNKLNGKNPIRIQAFRRKRKD